MRRLTAGLAGLAMLAGLAACSGPAGRGTPPAGGAAAATTTTGARAAPVQQRAARLSGRQLTLAVYYLRSYKGRRYLAPEWHQVPATRAVAAAALGELLGGQPLCRGSRRPFPAGTRLGGVRVAAGTATVDLAGRSLPARPGASRWPLQALVHTLAQFPTIDRVLVRVGGKPAGGPLTRDRDLPLAPIALAEPAAGALVRGGRVVVRGEASVYEATVGLRLRDDHGQVMAQGHATAARGAPGRGPFSGSLSFTAPATSHAWTLEAFEVSPEDGAITYAVQVPLWVVR
jgi:immunoglobulin-like protein involved in spore germination/sporulation and spore germination protein